MDGLNLGDLNLSSAEKSYTEVFHELAEISHQNYHEPLVCDSGDYHAQTALNIPAVRGWLRDRFCTLSLGQIDQVSSHHVQVIGVVDTYVSNRSYR